MQPLVIQLCVFHCFSILPKNVSVSVREGVCVCVCRNRCRHIWRLLGASWAPRPRLLSGRAGTGLAHRQVTIRPDGCHLAGAVGASPVWGTHAAAGGRWAIARPTRRRERRSQRVSLNTAAHEDKSHPLSMFNLTPRFWSLSIDTQGFLFSKGQLMERSIVHSGWVPEASQVAKWAVMESICVKNNALSVTF